MRKETQLAQIAKIQKQNVIVFKKRNSARLKLNFRELEKQDDFQLKTNMATKTKPLIPEEIESFSKTESKIQRKNFPQLNNTMNNYGKKMIIQKTLLQYTKNIPPTSLFHDKEAYLQQSIQLKSKNNELSNEIMKLKTKLATLEKQNNKLQKLSDEDPQGKKLSLKQIKVKPNDQTLTSLKLLLKESKKENQQLKEQNNKMKKSLKYIRINQLEQEKQAFQEQIIKLRQLLEQQLNQNIHNKLNIHDKSQLQQRLLIQLESNNNLKKQNNELNQKIKLFDEKLKGYSKCIQTEKNLNKNIGNLRKALKQKQSQLENLKKNNKSKQKQKQQVSVEKPKIPSSSKKIRNQKFDSRTTALTLSCEYCTKTKQDLQESIMKITNLQNQIKQKNLIIQKLSQQQNYSNSNKTIVKKPSIEFIKHITQFLIYRFKAHHLPLDLVLTYFFKKDSITTPISQMAQTLLVQPFFITNSEYLEALIIHLYYSERIQSQFQIDQKFEKPNQQLSKILKSLFKQYTIDDRKTEEELFIQIAQLITNYSKHISAAFDHKRNGEGTLDRIELYNFFNQIQLEKQYIEFIITQIILDSFDLEHLNYYALLQIFYLPTPKKQIISEKQFYSNHKMPLENTIKEQDEQYEQSIATIEKNKQDQDEIKKTANSKFNQPETQLKKGQQQEEEYGEDFCNNEETLQIQNNQINGQQLCNEKQYDKNCLQETNEKDK